MVYIVVALKAEAQAFVDRYKLTKTKLSKHTLFYSDTLTLIVSGIGVAKAREATQTLINHFDITDADSYLNVGIAAADTTFQIGELLEIGSISYHGINYTFDTSKEHILCSDSEVAGMHKGIVDMESYGFYDAVIHNPAIQHFAIFKVVSDHFQPDKITKEQTKMLLFHKLDAILQLPKELS